MLSNVIKTNSGVIRQAELCAKLMKLYKKLKLYKTV